MTEREHDDLPAPPAPAAGFRGALGRRLDAEAPPPGRPERLWLWVGLSLAGAVVLLLVAVTGIPA